MQEQTDNTENTVTTTGRGYNRHATDADNSATGVAADLYAPVRGDDNDTRPGMVESSQTPSMTTSRDRTDESPRSTDTATPTFQQRTESTPSQTYSSYAQRPRNTSSDGGVMQKIQANPLAVVAAATAGGMLVGRMMRNRGKDKQRNEGYLRNASSRGYQGYQSYTPYQQPSFRPYQGNAGYQGYSGNQGYQQPGYQMPSGFQGAPQYRPEQEFQQGQGFQGSHENFPGGSNWD